MKRFLVPSLLLAVVLGLSAATAPRVSRGTLAAMEKSLDERISRLWDDNPYLLLGQARGVYLDSYGAVFTTELNLVANPVSLMHATLSKDEIARFRQKKLDRLPILKKAGPFPYPDGTVFADDVHDFSVKDGSYVEGAKKAVTVMVKDSKKYATTGGWGFQVWAGGDPSKPLVPDAAHAVQACFVCHTPQKDQDYTFSTYIP